jgi:arabinogalactan oligomer / maltooligosaccharide transport system permease protein
VSSSAATPAAPAASAPVKWSLPARAIAFFSGPVGLGVKIALLAIVNAIAVWGAVVLAMDEKWLALVVCVAATLAIDAVYLSKRSYPLKFLIPGTVFLLAFQIAPILYNVNIAFTNWSTGHFATKDEAIVGIQLQSLAQSATGGVYVMAPARDESGGLVLVLVDDETGQAYIGTEEGLEEQPAGSVETSQDGLITGAPEGYTLVPPEQLLALDRQLSQFTVPVDEGRAAIRPEGLESAVTLQPTLRYDAETDTFTRISDGTVFTDNGAGSFESADGEELEPGWKTHIGLANFSAIFTDPLVRDPFLRVFAWTFFFAFSCVFLSFALGLFLAIALDKSGMRFQRTYRSALVIPYAVPGFLSLLVWAGLLNDDFGVVNNVLHTSIPWLFDPTWAKVSVILVSVWLTFPYFFLVSMAALQSIPGELVEAARVDGGGPLQIFRRVTLPLLLVAVAPLLIASFAFNFNNFNNVYLLTGGGPPAEDQSVAGSTDILISYTYKLAFEAGKGNDYGLAAAVSIVIFFIVAAISAVGFWRTKSLETMA